MVYFIIAFLLWKVWRLVRIVMLMRVAFNTDRANRCSVYAAEFDTRINAARIKANLFRRVGFESLAAWYELEVEAHTVVACTLKHNAQTARAMMEGQSEAG